MLTAKPRQSGQQLIELIIASGILLMYAHAIFTVILGMYQLANLTKSEAVARAIAVEQMELLRNLPYDDIGTLGGIPAGNLPQTQVITRNNQDFTVKTDIRYVDDPFDNTSPGDLLATDYKVAKISVIWSGAFTNNKQLDLVTYISPKGVENTTGGGTLKILVFDSQGQPVPQADVSIEATAASPPVDLDLFTDDNGLIILPGAPSCNECYYIEVSKTNYSQDRTYSSSEVTNPTQPWATILDNQVTEVSFAIDKLANITWQSTGSRASGFPALGNVTFHLRSGKTIGTDSGGQPVYKLDQDYTTDSTGQLLLSMEWDSYQLTVDNTSYDLAGVNPLTPISILPDQSQTIKFAVIPHQPYNLLAIAKDASGSAIASASAQLTATGFDQTLTTGQSTDPDFGQAMFENLTSRTYQLTISHPSFAEATASVDVTGNQQQEVILNPL